MTKCDYTEALARRAVADAKRRKLTPLAVTPGIVQNWPPFPFPYLGDYLPDGWKLNEVYIVTNAYFSEVTNDVISQQAFQEILARHAVSDRVYGYGVLQIGQCTSCIAEYVQNH